MGIKSILLAATALVLSINVNASIIGVDINSDSNSGTPINWNSYTWADANTTMSNLVAEDGSITGIGFQLNGRFSFQNADPADSSVIPLHTTDLTTVCCDILHGGPNPTVSTWSGLTAFATYNYWVFTSSSATDTITASGNTIDSFVSPPVVSTSQNINGVLGSNLLTFSSFARQVEASASGTINIDILSNGTPTPSGYAVEFVSAVPIPAAVWLFGSGLIGLIGVARRKES